MATCSTVISNALKLAKVLPAGGSPTSSETTDGLACLQSLYDHWLHNGMFGALEDIYLEENDTAEEGKRYFVPTGLTLTDATSVYVDELGETRQPRDLAVYESLTEAGTRTVKLYDRSTWRALTGLASGDEAPLSSRGAMGLAACLATSGAFASMFGAVPDPDVRMLALQFQGSLMSKATTQDRTAAEFF